MAVTLIDGEPTPTQYEGDRRWPIIAVAAALVAIAVGGLMLVIGDDDPASKVPADQPATNAPPTVAQVTEESLQLSDRRVREAAARRIGFVGLPPVGARPSTPEGGILVLDFASCTTSPWFDGLSVFADGRLIWEASGHLVEQRLTPEGVELMRSELLGSGLFDGHDDDDECMDGKYYGHSEVTPDWMGSEFGAPLYAQIARLADPWSWLPASAWEDREIKAFVSSEYSILISGGSGRGGVTHTSDPAPELPAAVQELVNAKEWECQGPPSYCYTAFTTDEARALAEALDAAGFVAEIGDNGYLEYHPDDGTSTEVVQMRPRLPNEVGVGPVPG